MTESQKETIHRVMPLLIPFVLFALGGLTTWIWKLDDRVYGLQREMVHRVELDQRFEAIDDRLARIELKLDRIAGNGGAKP